jgi:predicted ArsR family transcriptional regulator
MVPWHPTQDKVLVVLSEGVPLTSNDIVQRTGLTKHSVWSTLKRCWENGLILRSQTPIFESKKKFRGRKGYRTNTRGYYKYIINSARKDHLIHDGITYVSFSEEHTDPRSARKESKAQQILRFLEEHSDSAFFSKDISDAHEHKGVRVTDVMPTVRRNSNLVYVRGYRSDDRQTPFKEGYLLTWLDQSLPREAAIQEAIERTDQTLQDRSSTNPVIERVHGVRDKVIGSSKLRELTGVTYLQSELGITEYELETAIEKVKQLYPDIREIKLFNAYRYFYHDSMTEEDLHAATIMKENYIRKAKGRANRIGHNWEAVPEWFIDTFTTGARFWTQEHRGSGMDPRRITIYLLKPVGSRRRNAEVDRVWEVTPGVFAQPITYVLARAPN